MFVMQWISSAFIHLPEYGFKTVELSAFIGSFFRKLSLGIKKSTEKC